MIDTAEHMVDRSSNNNQRLVVTHAVLAGLTPLIPVPLVDDIAKTYFLRSLGRRLSTARGYSFSSDEIKLLADDPDSGCLRGCATTTLILPFKLIFRKVFFFLEWKRAVDIVSHVYYRGYLLEHVLAEGWCAPAGPRSATEVRAAIDTVLQRVNTSLIERAVRNTFTQSKSILKRTASMLGSSLKKMGRRASPAQVAEAVEAIEAREATEIDGIAAQLQNAIAKIPSEHFQGLKEELAAELGRAQNQPATPS